MTASNLPKHSRIMEWFSDMYPAYKKGAERRAMRKQTPRELNSLTDSELQDIGISPSDITSLMNGIFLETKMLLKQRQMII